MATSIVETMRFKGGTYGNERLPRQSTTYKGYNPAGATQMPAEIQKETASMGRPVL